MMKWREIIGAEEGESFPKGRSIAHGPCQTHPGALAHCVLINCNYHFKCFEENVNKSRNSLTMHQQCL